MPTLIATLLRIRREGRDWETEIEMGRVGRERKERTRREKWEDQENMSRDFAPGDTLIGIFIHRNIGVLYISYVHVSAAYGSKASPKKILQI